MFGNRSTRAKFIDVSPKEKRIACDPNAISVVPATPSNSTYQKDVRFWLDVAKILRNNSPTSRKYPSVIFLKGDEEKDITLLQKAIGSREKIFIPDDNPEVTTLLKKADVCDGQIISHSIRDILEAKCKTAVVWNLLHDTQKGKQLILDYFHDMGQKKPSEEFIHELISFAKKILPKSSIIPPYKDLGQNGKLNKKDLFAREIRHVLQKFNGDGNGIIFQIDESSSGRGTAIIPHEKISELLQQSDEKLFSFLERKLKLSEIADHSLIDELAMNGISYQEKILFKDEGSMIFDNDGHNNFLPILASNQEVTDDGAYRGTILHKPDYFNFYQKNKTNFDLIHLIALHTMLKRENLDGLHTIDQDSASNNSKRLGLFGVDLFIKDDNSLVCSEYNVRPTGSTRANNSRKYLHTILEYPTESLVLRNPPAYFSRSQMEALHKKGAKWCADFILNELDKYTHTVPDAVFDGSHFIQSNPNHNRISLGMFFPAPTQGNQTEKVVTSSIFEKLKDLSGHHIEKMKDDILLHANQDTQQQPHEFHEEPSHTRQKLLMRYDALCGRKPRSFECPI